MKITTESIRTMQCAKQFKEHTNRVNSMHFSMDGLSAISSSDDESIVVYDSSTGTNIQLLYSHKYGVDKIQFAHNINNAIHCSTKIDHTIRYMSLPDTRYIRYFEGHADKVTTLTVSPSDDKFLSASLDRTIRLWDLRSPKCHGIVNVLNRPVAAYDPEGMIFGLAINDELIKLYDLRSYERGPFATFPIGAPDGAHWTNMQFSPNGKLIMMNTNSDRIQLVDAFDGRSANQTLFGHANDKHISLEATFSPDSNFVFCGSSDSRIYAWNASTGEQIAHLDTDHTALLEKVVFNPRFYMLASTCQKVCFWLSSIDE